MSDIHIATEKLAAPKAPKKPKELTIHGHTRIDPYFWLNERENPEVIKYLDQENAFTQQYFDELGDQENELFEELKGRVKPDDESVPYFSNGYFYYHRFEDGKEYAIYCRKKGDLKAAEEVLIDENKLAEGKSFCQVGSMVVSPDNKLLAFAIDTVGRRQFEVRVKNLGTGNVIGDSIKNVGTSLAWAANNQQLFYAAKDDSLRQYKIFRHSIGSPQIEDVEIFHEEDEAFHTYVYLSKSREYVMIGSSSTVSSEYQMIPSNNPEIEAKMVQDRERDLLYYPQHLGDELIIRTNHNALNFKLVRTALQATEKENWREILAHREDVLLEDVELFKNYMVIKERTNGLTHIRVFDLKNDLDYYVNFDEPSYVAYISVNREFNTKELRFGYTSMTTPISTYSHDMESRESTLLKRKEILGGYDQDKFQTERFWTTANDGTKVPVTVAYKKGLLKDGSNRCFITGYGSYGHSTDPIFSTARVSLLERGFVVALAHVRGGEDLGRQWYEDGKMLNKRNTFTDFIACSEELINQGYTSSEQLFAWGGSAGGLLMGAIMNLRPDLYKGIVAAVPFVDVVTTMLDESIPLTTGEYDEWGNPNDKEYYEYILSYSPYDNIEQKSYPALLITTGLHDSQVQYWEPAKWISKLRDLNQGSQPLLMYTNMDAGHGGSSGRFEAFRETAKSFAFILSLVEN